MYLFGLGLYTDNYYVRLLTGNCGDCHLRTVKKPHKSDIGMVQGCTATTNYYKYAKVDMSLYCKAVEMASAFQIIVITEYYDKPSMNAWLRRELERLTHLPRGYLDEVSLGHERNHIKEAPVPLPKYRYIPDCFLFNPPYSNLLIILHVYRWLVLKVNI